MVDIAINDVARRIQYSGNTGLGPFQFTFNILNQADLAVYKNSTALTLTTDYTVIVNANGTGSITLTGTGNGTAVILADVITIVGDMALARVTDFAPGGDFQTAAVNEQLDSMIVMLQQLDEKIARSVKGPVQDTITGFTLPTDRKGKVLAFDATTGAPTNGPTVSAVNNAEANAIAAAASATSAAASAASAAASFDAFDDIYLGSYATDPTLDNDGNALTVGDQYFNSVANELRVWNGTTWQAASTVGGTVSSLAVTGVASFADGTAAAPSIAHTGDLNAGLFFPAADTVAVATAGVERMRVDSSGNVGIGIAAPTAPLQVYNATDASIVLQGDSNSAVTISRASSNVSAPALGFRKLRGTTASPLAVVSADVVGNINYGAWDGSALVVAAQIQSGVETFTGVSDVSGYLRFATRPIGSSSAITEAMRINSSGNVGIGTSSPVGKLDIVTGTYRAYFDDPGGTSVRLNGVLANNSAYGPLTVNGSILAMQTSGVERMRIDTSGNVGIGNTAPVTPLHVTGASITTGVVYKAQPAQTSKAAAATLTIAELLTGIVQYTGAVATLTLPTGTSIEGGLPATFPTDMSFDVSFINTGAALLTIGANGNTTVGTMTVATGTSDILRFRKTAANTYTVYRIS